MIKSLYALTLCLLLMPLLFSRASAGEKVVLATLEWPPYVGAALKDQGYAAAVVREAFQRSGMEVDIKFHQWSRVVGLAKRGAVDGYFPEYDADDIHAYALFSDPFPAGPLGFFKRTDSKIDFSGLADLKPYRIGVVQGYVNTKAFDRADFLDKHPVKDDLTNLRMLLAGRVDLMVADKYVGYYLIRRHMPEDSGLITFHPKILEPKHLFLCISKKKKNARRLTDAFNRGLNRMKADGALKALLADMIKTSDKN